MDKKLIETIIITILISSFLGFYVGRSYERKSFGNRMQERGGSEFRMGERRGFPLPEESTMSSDQVFDN